MIISDRRNKRSDGRKSLQRLGSVPASETMIRCSNRFRSVSGTGSGSFEPERSRHPTRTESGWFFRREELPSTDLLTDISRVSGSGRRRNPVVEFSPADECRPDILWKKNSTGLPNRVRFSDLDSFSSSSTPGFEMGSESSTRRTSSGSTRYRQSGHVEWASSQVSTHSTWNACLHLGSNRRTSVGSNRVKQTAHSSPSFWPRSDPNRKTGSDSITARSIPEFLRPDGV